MFRTSYINPLNVELNPICHILALLGAHHIFHVSGLRINNQEYYIVHCGHIWHVFHVFMLRAHPSTW